MGLFERRGNLGVGTWPARRARISPDAVALVQGERSLTYTELAGRAARLAAVLSDRGVSRGERIAYLGTNDIRTFETFFAAGLLGAILAPLNTRLAPAEVAHMLRDSGSRVLVVGHGVDDLAASVMKLDHAVESVLALPGVEAGDAATDDYEMLVEQAEPFEDLIDVGLDDPALLLYTSGTTGRPKAAVLTHGSLTWNTFNQLGHIDFVSTDRILCFAPLFHAVGFGQSTLATLFKGGTVEMLAGFDAGAVLRTIGEHRVTGMAVVPTMLQMMVEHPDWDDADLSSLRYVNYGGSPATERISRAWQERGVVLQQGYGMTEAAPGVYMAPREGSQDKPVSVGVPHFFTDVAMLQDDRAVPVGPEQRELLVRGPHLFDGYWNQPDASAETVVEGSWFRSGDILRVDDDGWAHVVDRVKDVIISGGENIYPAEVEAALTELASIRSAAVVARPDERWGEVGVAFLERAAGSSVTEDEVRVHLAGRLARYKTPAQIVFVDDLPRNASGKVLRVDLRRRVQAEGTTS
ncbi:long-chain fatty acid--CoA ligase [Aeromicrobium sp. CTD01-1L150]|uniref:acyl-CoA synthetase n=1 Tax=Aeromicrobium sp. CTD01-1L150 TaxID=3341830 RepID=UPI0035C05128